MKEIHTDTIRRIYDQETGLWQYSVVDVITSLAVSNDARNYWKSLKNRLKKTSPELVMQCNQLKLPASDGKSYATDAATSSTLLHLIAIISPTAIKEWESWFGKIAHENRISTPTEHATLSTGSDAPAQELQKDEGEVEVDLLETPHAIVLRAAVAGISPDRIMLSVGCRTVLIRGARVQQKDDVQKYFSTQELTWGMFSRTIPLPALVDINLVDTTLAHGLLTITLQKIDRARMRTIRIIET